MSTESADLASKLETLKTSLSKIEHAIKLVGETLEVVKRTLEEANDILSSIKDLDPVTEAEEDNLQESLNVERVLRRQNRHWAKTLVKLNDKRLELVESATHLERRIATKDKRDLGEVVRVLQKAQKKTESGSISDGKQRESSQAEAAASTKTLNQGKRANGSPDNSKGPVRKKHQSKPSYGGTASFATPNCDQDGNLARPLPTFSPTPSVIGSSSASQGYGVSSGVSSSMSPPPKPLDTQKRQASRTSSGSPQASSGNRFSTSASEPPQKGRVTSRTSWKASDSPAGASTPVDAPSRQSRTSSQARIEAPSPSIGLRSVSQTSTPSSSRRTGGKDFHNPSSTNIQQHCAYQQADEVVYCRPNGAILDEQKLWEYLNKRATDKMKNCITNEIKSWEVSQVVSARRGNREPGVQFHETPSVWDAGENVCLRRFCNCEGDAHLPGEDPEQPHVACEACVATNRVCFIRPDRDSFRIVMLPLPTGTRRGADPKDLKHWVKNPDEYMKCNSGER